MRQWMLRITAYGDRLLEDLAEVDWPEGVKEMQRNWIGKSEGAELDFELEGRKEKLRVFTTRPDTIFGVTFMVLAPESEWVRTLTTPAESARVESYLNECKRKTERERQVHPDARHQPEHRDLRRRGMQLVLEQVRRLDVHQIAGR